MGLALFDLDNTLLCGDSDYLWGRFLVDEGVVDGEEYERQNQEFYRQYQEGSLQIEEFLNFSLQPLAARPAAELHRLRERFLDQIIAPIMQPAAHTLLDRHRAGGDTLVIITATNRFITAPIAERFGVSHLLATEVEVIDGRYTGRSTGIPCFREGKVRRLDAWLEEQGQHLVDSWFYSDSHNDLPLLERVRHPVAVDPDDTLRRQARQRGWPIISLRDSP